MLHRPSMRAVAGRSICLLNRQRLDKVRKARGDRGYITGQTIAAQTKNLKGDISLAALDAPFNSFAPSHRPRQKLPDSSVVLCEPFGFSCQARLKFPAAAIIKHLYTPLCRRAC